MKSSMFWQIVYMILLLLIWLLIPRMVSVVNRRIYWVSICLFHHRKERGVAGSRGGGPVRRRSREAGHRERYPRGGGPGYGRGRRPTGSTHVGTPTLWRGGFNIKYYNQFSKIMYHAIHSIARMVKC